MSFSSLSRVRGELFTKKNQRATRKKGKPVTAQLKEKGEKPAVARKRKKTTTKSNTMAGIPTNYQPD